jgi:hypothetical protein
MKYLRTYLAWPVKFRERGFSARKRIKKLFPLILKKFGTSKPNNSFPRIKAFCNSSGNPNQGKFSNNIKSLREIRPKLRAARQVDKKTCLAK